MKRVVTIFWLAWVLASAVCTAAAASATPESDAKPGLVVKNGLLFKEGRPYRAIGANYFDLFLRLLQNPTNTSSLAGLRQLSQAGIPFVRFSGGGFSKTEWQLYLKDPQEHFRRLDRVVRVAEEAKIGLIPSVFWTLALPDSAGETREEWLKPESKARGRMRGYVRELVRRYKQSPAIWGWEFGNELNLSVDLPNAAEFRQPAQTARDDLTSAHLVELIAEFGREVRREDTWRPIFSGNSQPRASAWHNTRAHSWEPDTREQAGEILQRDNPAPLDTIGIHVYASDAGLKDLPGWAPTPEAYLKWVTSVAKGLHRPVFVGEFGVPGPDNAENRRRFDELLGAVQAAEVDLAAFWVFDLANQEADWNVTFLNRRSWMLDAVVKANRSWRTAIKGR